jgi:hypothetical protein
VLVAHACNPSYSGSRDQDGSSKPTLGKQFEKPHLEKIHHKNRAGGVSQGVGPEFKPWYHQKKTNTLHTLTHKYKLLLFSSKKGVYKVAKIHLIRVNILSIDFVTALQNSLILGSIKKSKK